MYSKNKTIFTIGHSNHSLDKFLSLVKANEIKVIVDVRSRPFSRFAFQFNKPALQNSLNLNNFDYIYLGDKLGGKPDDKKFYDSEGNVVYSRISDTPEFQDGIEKVIEEAKEHLAALMCSEENPLNCHRFHLVTKFLETKGIIVNHIRGDGRCQTGEDLALEIAGNKKEEKQLNLFQQE